MSITSNVKQEESAPRSRDRPETSRPAVRTPQRGFRYWNYFNSNCFYFIFAPKFLVIFCVLNLFRPFNLKNVFFAWYFISIKIILFAWIRIGLIIGSKKLCDFHLPDDLFNNRKRFYFLLILVSFFCGIEKPRKFCCNHNY